MADHLYCSTSFVLLKARTLFTSVHYIAVATCTADREVTECENEKKKKNFFFLQGDDKSVSLSSDSGPEFSELQSLS